MTDEVNNTDNTSIDVIPQGQEIAQKQGWRPQEAWEGDPKDWVDWPEFNRRGELIDQIRTVKHKLKENEKAL